MSVEINGTGFQPLGEGIEVNIKAIFTPGRLTSKKGEIFQVVKVTDVDSVLEACTIRDINYSSKGILMFAGKTGKVIA